MKNLIFALLTILAPLCATGQSTALTNAITTLKNEAQATADAETKSLANDFGAKVLALSKSLEGNAGAQKQLENAVNAVLGNKGPAAIEGLGKLASAKFTPEQSMMAKDAYNVGSAYVVKRNFGSLEGSQGEVSQIVNALRKGNTMEAVPPLKKIGQNATLTQPQKDLLASLTDRYAPGLKKAGEGLKSLPGFKK